MNQVKVKDQLPMMPLSRHSIYLFLGIFLIRTINSFILRTYFDPDEHWQSTEIAYNIVFGQGWRTWEWRVGLRSFIYPLPFIIFYQILKIFSLNKSDLLVIYGPKFIGAINATFIDYF